MREGAVWDGAMWEGAVQKGVVKGSKPGRSEPFDPMRGKHVQLRCIGASLRRVRKANKRGEVRGKARREPKESEESQRGDDAGRAEGDQSKPRKT